MKPRMSKYFSSLLLPFFILNSNLYGLVEGTLGKIDASTTVSTTYDSRVFGVSSGDFSQIRSNQGTNSKLRSEDDFILTFSPALHYTKKLRWFSFGANAGIQLAHFVRNSEQNYVRPTTTLTVDFDDTLSKNKRISNNAKIRFDATFDIGQSVGASIIEQDLTSYTYFTAGFNVRYNHSPKFGVGAGTSYNYKYYQSGGLEGAIYNDIETLPISTKLFYIYSEKLDFYTDYTFQRTQDDVSGSENLTDGNNHSISVGAQGIYSSKLSGNANIGYSVRNFDNDFTNSDSDLVSSVGLNWKYNSKTNFTFDLSRAFSPSASGFSMFSTMLRFGMSHRFTEDLRGLSYLSVSKSNFKYASNFANDTSSMNDFGFGVNLTKQLSKAFTLSGKYDFNYIDRGIQNYGRHVINTTLTGRF